MLCHLHRWMIERALDSDRPLPRSVQRHLARCARCAQHAQQHQSLQARLQLEARAEQAPAASTHATQRIMSAVRRAPRATQPVAPPWLPQSLPPALAVAAMLAVAWGVSVWTLWPTGGQALPEDGVVHTAPADGAAWPGLSDGQAPPFWTVSDAADLERWLSRDMEQELEHLRHDAAHFVDLVLGPLPEGL